MVIMQHHHCHDYQHARARQSAAASKVDESANNGLSFENVVSITIEPSPSSLADGVLENTNSNEPGPQGTNTATTAWMVVLVSVLVMATCRISASSTRFSEY
ncbi:hypothetical protein TWF696_004230 [Orbilia brochopaga]|uniref:Uncharacterized protein n=1 Tax=Orbilia brochopaga TaxID=3140254 RepID=A0AAV9V5H7_9PEZI